MLEQVLWTEKYRPKRIADCVLPTEKRKIFQNMVNSGEVLNLLLCGSSGTGKTTVAKAMCEEMGLDYIVINGSMQGNIDTLRNEIYQFASSISIVQGGRKVVILDEADYLNMNSTQPALRNFMEEFAINCAFILTCNYPNRIIDPLKSRLSMIDFSIPQDEKTVLLRESVKKIRDILVTENVTFDLAVVAKLTSKLFPDLRKTINELQTYARTGKIDAGIFAGQATIGDIVKILKSKKFNDMRTWVAHNAGVDFHMFVTDLYETMSKEIETNKIPYLILILNKYDYQNAFVGNKEINMAAMLQEIMSDCL